MSPGIFTAYIAYIRSVVGAEYVLTKSKKEGRRNLRPFLLILIDASCNVCCVQKFVGLMSAWLTQICIIKFLNYRIIMALS